MITLQVANVANGSWTWIISQPPKYVCNVKKNKGTFKDPAQYNFTLVFIQAVVELSQIHT